MRAIKVRDVIIRLSSLNLELTYEDICGNLRKYIDSSHEPRIASREGEVDAWLPYERGGGANRGVTTMHNDDELLFVYGSLMDPAERVRLLHRPIEAAPARLVGYQRGQKRYYFVASQADAITDGAILEGLGARDLAILDAYEDVPRLYTRDRIEVLGADGRHIECWIYLPTEWAKEP